MYSADRHRIIVYSGSFDKPEEALDDCLAKIEAQKNPPEMTVEEAQQLLDQFWKTYPKALAFHAHGKLTIPRS